MNILKFQIAPMKKIVFLLVLALELTSGMALFSVPAYAARNELALTPADADFLMLRDSSLRGEIAQAGRIADRLSNYPIASYVEYYRLYPRLISAPEGEIRAFMDKYAGTAIADRLRNDWLLLLGHARIWRTFDEQYPLFTLNDDTQVKCYALLSRVNKHENVAKQARDLLLQPNQYGVACADLIINLYKEKYFKADDVWHQIRLAAEYGQISLARRLAGVTDATEKKLAIAIDKPGQVIDHGIVAPRASHELFIIALGRVARHDSAKSVQALNKVLNKLSEEEQSLAWAQIALQASLQLSRDAASYWRRTWGVQLSQDAYQWRARAALRAGDWSMVSKAISSMPPELQKDSTWVYWHGRADKAQGRNEEAQKHFQSIATLSNFYGLLANEELGQKAMVSDKPIAPKPEELAEASNNKGFQHAFRFFDLGLRFEGNREWNWQLRRMNERQLLAAAEFARQSDVLDRMVTTADRARVELDFTHRFPTPHDDIMHTAIQPMGLDKAWVYGLIRQESRFIKSARSHVGASGLMQIMPATAKYVARKIGMTSFTLNNINDTQTNITLGTQYLNMVLTNLGGSQTLATAAYNAGPGRPRLWRASLERQIEGAIFAETIPFSETRTYVKNVLANATWYAALFENKPQSLKARLGYVMPGDVNLPELGDLP
jgi:soluble lytic murein transglycosylase